MKIYASKRRPNDFTKFVGKGIWVRCYDGGWSKSAYVNLLKIYPADWDPSVTMIQYKEIFVDIIETADSNLISWQQANSVRQFRDRNSFDFTMDRGLDYFLEEYTFVVPYDVMTDEEMRDQIECAYQKVDQLDY